MHKRPFSAISSRDPYIRGVISPISSAQRGSWLKYPRYARNGTRRAASRKHAAHGGGQTGSRGRTAAASREHAAHGGPETSREQPTENARAKGSAGSSSHHGGSIAPWRHSDGIQPSLQIRESLHLRSHAHTKPIPYLSSNFEHLIRIVKLPTRHNYNLIAFSFKSAAFNGIEH